jgi:DNA-binding CsgD family transcriptional regulator
MVDTTQQRAASNKQWKLTEVQELEVVRLLQNGVNLELVAVQFGVHSNTVRFIKRRHGLMAKKGSPTAIDKPGSQATGGPESPATSQDCTGGHAA